MSDEERLGAMRDLAAEMRVVERLQALAEYAELRNRWLIGESRPGDRSRRMRLRATLERTGGIPQELHWPQRR